MDNSKPVGIPVETGTQLVKAKDGDDLVDQELYQSAVGSHFYLSTKTRPDIAYAVGNVAHFSLKPSQTHWVAVKRIMGYLNETPDFQLLCVANDNITEFLDADWAGDDDDQKSTSINRFSDEWWCNQLEYQETNLCSFFNSRSRIHRIGNSEIDMVTATSNGYERKLCGSNDNF